MKPVQYTNRDGETFYLHAVRLKGGRTLYVMRKRASGALSGMPEGYEVREGIHGHVSVRRKRPRSITEVEEQLVRNVLSHLRPAGYELDFEGRAATVYASALDRKSFAGSIDADFAEGFAEVLTKALAKKYPPELVAMFRARRQQETAKRPRLYPLLRFVLTDKDRRLFAVERVCFTGDRAWVRLEALPLSAALMKYLPHLGRDSFFDLI